MIAEVWISVIAGFISGAICGFMAVLFYMRNKDRHIKNGT